ncbi:hypothetical protein Hypma_008618 [Hypsizygus marmoreus]|uniref:Uncharacterized protein n=1 Tax=Hypsizygus marmoreus TaxID=39966 RepID=A0A369JS53_HYPMA|nr:hypothetical protein Hypma_008618 [Hypsizygus marmoreus]
MSPMQEYKMVGKPDSDQTWLPLRRIDHDAPGKIPTIERRLTRDSRKPPTEIPHLKRDLF